MDKANQAMQDDITFKALAVANAREGGSEAEALRAVLAHREALAQVQEMRGQFSAPRRRSRSSSGACAKSWGPSAS